MRDIVLSGSNVHAHAYTYDRLFHRDVHVCFASKVSLWFWFERKKRGARGRRSIGDFYRACTSR